MINVITVHSEKCSDVTDLNVVVLKHGTTPPKELSKYKAAIDKLDVDKELDSLLISEPHENVANTLIVSTNRTTEQAKTVKFDTKLNDLIVGTINKVKAKDVCIRDSHFINNETLATALVVNSYKYENIGDYTECDIAVELYNVAKKRVDATDEVVAKGEAMGRGINYARFLGDLPANYCNPSFLCSEAMELAEGDDHVNVRIITEEMLEEMGAGSFVSVSKGSIESGRMIIIEYNNFGDAQPSALVGKGVTFDSGGISLKPGARMHEMKFDMLGSAAVMGAMKTLIESNSQCNVVAVIGAAENMPSDRATKPGDVVTSLSGQTIEVQNTDAEGRLILCDCLTYVQDNYNPCNIIDVATLTGACAAALGSHATGIFTNNEEFADGLRVRGQELNEKLWELPIWDEYDKQLDSNVADMANIGTPGAGASTAACFLNRFVDKDTPWVHMDIAGTAWKGGKATGVGVKTLVKSAEDVSYGE
jgi:leucyl aminopeptidase